MQSGSYRPKITGLKYHMYFPSAPPPIFREVWEAHHLVTRLLLWKIIAHQPLSGNLFFQPSQTQKANEPVNPFTGWHLQSKWGFTERIPGRNAPIMEKGMFQMHFIGISLGYNKSFPWWKRKAVYLYGLIWLLCKNALLIFHVYIR